MLLSSGVTSTTESLSGLVTMSCVPLQEIFLEIERRVAALSALGPTSDLPHPQLDEVGAVGSQQEAAELLSSKLELLKADLVSVQQQLQQRRSTERSTTQVSDVTSCQTQQQRLACVADIGVCAQKPDPQPERPLASRLKHSSSYQEVFSSPRNKLLRQSSLQQQKVNYGVFNAAP